jgi:hypothetical protein
MQAFLSRPRSGLSLVVCDKMLDAIKRACGVKTTTEVYATLTVYNAEKRQLAVQFVTDRERTNPHVHYAQLTDNVDGTARARWLPNHCDFYPEHGVVTVTGAQFEFRPKDASLTLHLPPLDKCPPAIRRNRENSKVDDVARDAVVAIHIQGLKQQTFKVTQTAAFELALSLARSEAS